MIHQLRIYEIFEHNKSAFHERFRDHAARIMQKYGFDIVAMWEARSDLVGAIEDRLLAPTGYSPAVSSRC